MSLLAQLRKDAGGFVADAEAMLPLDASSVAAAGPASFTAYVVSPPEWWTLPAFDWLPPVMRGLPVYLPADDWWIPDWLVEAASTPASATVVARRRDGAESSRDRPCRDCGCPLFWEPVGQADSIRCVECSPPAIRRMVEDLWLAGGDGWLECVSKSPKWIRAAFAHLKPAEDLRRAEHAKNAARENEGF